MENDGGVQVNELTVGDQVILREKKYSGAEEQIIAKILEIRHILGEETYLIETGDGKRRVVSPNQVTRP